MQGNHIFLYRLKKVLCYDIFWERKQYLFYSDIKGRNVVMDLAVIHCELTH